MSISPFKFETNRVRRLYHGGNGIDRMRGKPDAGDGRYPEDWIASCIDANAREYVAPNHGVSTCIVNGRERLFPEILAEHAAALLGPEHIRRHGVNPGVLCKLLDSAVLLPMQVHPTNESARLYFNSNYGKCEAWIVLSTRMINGENPYLLLGFSESLDMAVFREECQAGEFKTALGMLHRFEVYPGDVFLVHGGMPHAIGPGITMVEVMEPTDLMIIPEKNCFGVTLPDEKRFGGLDFETAMRIFDNTIRSRETTLARSCPKPELLEENVSGSLWQIIAREREKFFGAQRLHLHGNWFLNLDPEKTGARTFRIGVVVKGKATLQSGETRFYLTAGESFFLPWETDECTLSGDAEIIVILPPL
ncbi:hypothetical protein OPIT5_23320 [Opitutaceae bacterium TAV5]|nr:hypothetical protein OPIT5_23320 [Opitutaceae bacterium TAV5]